MKQIFTLLVAVVLNASTYAQVGIGTTNPNTSAALDITSTTKGLLVPRMTQAQRNAISSPATWLIVICTDCGNSGELQMYNGTTWTNMIGGTASAGPTPNVTNPTTGRIWMDRNLGASQVATSSTDIASYGDLYQWGRYADGHELINWSSSPPAAVNAATIGTSTSTTPGNSFLSGSSNWYTGDNPNNFWQGVNGINNPCPSGYRLPTEQEWEAERATWSSQNAAGAFASPLKLPMPGNRSSSDGALFNNGTAGGYWSSTTDLSDDTAASYLFFTSSATYMVTNYSRAFGGAVRCLKDY